MGRGKILLNIAVMYTPIPKKAADPSDIYLVVPLKKCQLTANPIQHITLVSNVK